MYSLVNLGCVAHDRGDDALARERYREALELFDLVQNKSAVAKTLEDIAATIGALGDPSRAARLFGAADALRGTLRSPLFPSERTKYEAELSKIRAMLGDETFDVQWRIGASHTAERALEEARETLVRTV